MTAKDVIKAWLKVFNRADASEVAQLYAEGAVLHPIPDLPLEGREAIRAHFADLFAGPERICVLESLLEDDGWVVLEWRDPAGLRGCSFFQVAGDRILRQRSYEDRLSFFQQHGLPIPRSSLL